MEKWSRQSRGDPHDIGVIHGRFQVLHNDHLTYLLAGKAQCRHLVVGITNPDPQLTRDENLDRYRSAPSSNPLTYYERYRSVRAALIEAQVPEAAFSIVPFPINFPDLYRYYVPLDALFFLTIYDDWGRRKQRYFRSLGLKTHILRETTPEKKGISASDIRKSMADGAEWVHHVPASVAALLVEWDIPARIKGLGSGSSVSGVE